MNKFFDDFNKLFSRNIENVKDIDDKNVFRLNRWLGNSIYNYKLFLDSEEALLHGVPPNLVKKELFFRINKSNRYIKSTKYVSVERTFDWLKPFFGNFYGWSNREIEIYWGLIEHYLNNEKIKENIARRFGLNNRERKKLGLDKVKFVNIKPKEEMKGQVRLF